MSRLQLTGHAGARFELNVTQFRSPMSAAINSVQTHTMLQHFPIRCGQPDIEFTCRFTSLDEKHQFQNFVRQHQVNAINDSKGNVTLFWPERNIENWTGFITNFAVNERRFEYAPQVTFGVDLVDSMMSERTSASSFGASFDAIFGSQIGAMQVRPDLVDSILKLPSTLLNGLTGHVSAAGGAG